VAAAWLLPNRKTEAAPETLPARRITEGLQDFFGDSEPRGLFGECRGPASGLSGAALSCGMSISPAHRKDTGKVP
jgi:hypothetical protein